MAPRWHFSAPPFKAAVLADLCVSTQEPGFVEAPFQSTISVTAFRIHLGNFRLRYLEMPAMIHSWELEVHGPRRRSMVHGPFGNGTHTARAALVLESGAPSVFGSWQAGRTLAEKEFKCIQDKL